MIQGAGVDVLCKHGELAVLERRIHHEAHQRRAHKGVAAALGMGLQKQGRLLGEAGVKRAHGGIVVCRYKHREQGRRRIYAVDHVGLFFQLARGLLGKLFKGEGRGGLGGIAKQTRDALFEHVKEVHCLHLPGAPWGCQTARP